MTEKVNAFIAGLKALIAEYERPAPDNEHSWGAELNAVLDRVDEEADGIKFNPLPVEGLDPSIWNPENWQAANNMRPWRGKPQVVGGFSNDPCKPQPASIRIAIGGSEYDIMISGDDPPPPPSPPADPADCGCCFCRHQRRKAED